MAVVDAFRRILRREAPHYEPDLAPVVEADRELQDAKRRVRSLKMRLQVFSRTGDTPRVDPQ